MALALEAYRRGFTAAVTTLTTGWSDPATIPDSEDIQ